MHRFERSAPGESGRLFREIARDGHRCRTREGRVGTAGISRNSLHSTATEALDEVARLAILAGTEGYKPVALPPERIAFEARFGPIKRIVPANQALLDCRVPGLNYYNPSREATPPLFRVRLWNTGFYRLGVDGSAPENWPAVTEAAEIAWALAAALTDVVLSSDIDSCYVPFLFPKPVAPPDLAKYMHHALGSRAPVEAFRVTARRRPERFFWSADEAPEDYFGAESLRAIRRATALFRQSLDDLTEVSFDERFVNSPVFFGGFTPSGLYAGVFALRSDT